jgi:hypothetical protein
MFITTIIVEELILGVLRYSVYLIAKIKLIELDILKQTCTISNCL